MYAANHDVEKSGGLMEVSTNGARGSCNKYIASAFVGGIHHFVVRHQR